MSDLTLDRLKAWLRDDENVAEDMKAKIALGTFIKRRHFKTANGYALSIQMSELHNCKVGESVEMWQCPHHPLLMAYGDGSDPYCYVPLEVLAAYIDAIETLPTKEQS